MKLVDVVGPGRPPPVIEHNTTYMHTIYCSGPEESERIPKFCMLEGINTVSSDPEPPFRCLSATSRPSGKSHEA